MTIASTLTSFRTFRCRQDFIPNSLFMVFSFAGDWSLSPSEKAVNYLTANFPFGVRVCVFAAALYGITTPEEFREPSLFDFAPST